MGALTDNEYNFYDKSVNRFGKTNGDFFLEVSKGNCIGHKSAFNFGYVDEVDTAAQSDIIIQGGNYQFLDDAGEAIEVSSTSAADVGPIVLELLDENFVRQFVQIVLQGTTPVPIPGIWARCNGAVNVGSVEHVGIIDTVDTATGLKIVARMMPEDQVSQQAVYTIPAGSSGLVKLYGMSLVKSGGSTSSVAVNLKYRGFGGVFISTLRSGLTKDGTSTIAAENEVPTLFSEKTDLKFSARASSSSTSVSAMMQILLIENKYLV